MAKYLFKKTLYRSSNNLAYIFSFIYLSFFLLCALLADFLPLKYQPNVLDLENIYSPPSLSALNKSGSLVHWLGTDQIGRDVLANLIYGCRTALFVSMPAMLIAVFTGILLGGLAGYFGDRSLKISLASVIIFSVSIFLAYFYGFYIRQIDLSEAFAKGTGRYSLLLSVSIFVFTLSIGFIINKWLHRKFHIKEFLFIPVDQLVLKLIELLSSIPRIIFILCLSAFATPSVWNIIVITGFTYWTEPARLIRAELLRIKTLNYIESAKALGLADFYILIRHALPNALPSVIVAFTFGLTSLISLESTLSFLGIGVPTDIASWGRIVLGAKSNFSAWWLVVFPGMLLILTVLSLQIGSNYFIRKLDPRKK